MKATVYHDGEAVAIVDDGDFITSEEAIMEFLEYAYYRTQNIHGSWSLPYNLGEDTFIENGDFSEDVQVIGTHPVIDGKTYGIRSSMMGDTIKINDRTFEIKMFGFEEIK